MDKAESEMNPEITSGEVCRPTQEHLGLVLALPPTVCGPLGESSTLSWPETHPCTHHIQSKSSVLTEEGRSNFLICKWGIQRCRRHRYPRRIK